MMKHILDQPDLPARDLSSLEVLSYGGAPMPFPVIRRAIERFPRNVGFVNAFGQTETTSTLTVLGPEDHRLEGTAAEIELRTKRLKSIGRPLPDVEVRIVDEDGRELPAGEVGEIHVRTPRAMKGYAGAKDSPFTADGWLPTRDMGWIDDDGYLYVAGRKDDMIIRGGENIAPAEVEVGAGLAPGRRGGGRGRRARRRMGPASCGVRGAPAGRVGVGGGAGRVLPPAARELQEARGLPLPPRAAEEPDGQDLAARAARAVSASRTSAAVVTRIDDGVGFMQLARAATRNRLDLGLVQAVVDACEAMAADSAVRVVVLGAAGPDFSIGLPAGRGWLDPAWPDPVAAVAALPQPVIATIDGEARGWGLALALACDVRLVSTRAVLSVPDAGGGRLPGGGMTQRLPRMVGTGRASAMLLLGTRIRAADAVAWGLAAEAVAAGRLARAAAARARELAARGPVALRYAKEAVRRAFDLPLDDGVRLEHDLYVLLQTTADRRDGVEAFRARRRPRFTGQ